MPLTVDEFLFNTCLALRLVGGVQHIAHSIVFGCILVNKKLAIHIIIL